MCGRLFKKSHLKILLLLILILITVESTFQVKWKYNADDIIEICFILNRKSWIEVGLRKRMMNVDMLTVNIIDNKAEIIDLLSVEYDTHPTDTQQDLISYSIGDSTVKVRIKRKLNTGDSLQDMVLTKGSSYTWSYQHHLPWLWRIMVIIFKNFLQFQMRQKTH